MSNTVDSRVVEMQFDNKQFESAVQTSLNTLEKLKNSLKLENASRGLSNLQKASNSFTLEGMMASVDMLSHRFSTMGIVGMTVIQNLTTSAMHFAKNMWDNTIGQIKSGGLARAMNIEQAKFQLKGLDVEWNKIEKDISYGVKSTAYGLDAAAKAASQLVASGVQFGEEFGETGNSPMAKALRGISGVAAMTNSSYEEISSIYTTVAGQGKLMTMQLRQLESRGLNAAAQLGKVLGYTEEEIREFVTAGKIDFQTFSEAMDEAFGEHAKAANETYTGSLSNVRSALSRIGAKVATVYLEKMRNVFVALIPVIDNINQALDPFINLINKGITWASERAVKVLTKFNDALQNIMNPVRNVKKAVDEVKVVVDDVAHIEEMAWKVIRGDYGNGEARKKALTEEGENWALIQNKVNEFLDCPVRHEVEIQNKSIEEQAEVIAEVSNEYANWFYWQRRATGIWLALKRSVENIAEAFKRFGKAIGDAFKETNFRPLILFIQKTAEGIEDFTNNFKMGEEASNNLKNTFKGLISILKLVAEGFLFVVRAAFILISPIFDLIGAFTGVTGELGDFISGEVDAFEAADLFSGALKRLKKFMAPIRNTVKKLADSFAKLFKKSEMAEESGGILSTVFEKLTNILAGLGSALAKVIGWIKDGVVWVKNYVDNSKRLQYVFSVLRRVLETVGGAIYYVITNLGALIKGFWELPAVQKIVETVWGKIKEVLELIAPYFDDVAEEFGKFADKIKSFDSSSLEENLGKINSKLEALIQNAKDAWDNIKGFFASGDKVSSFMDTIESIPGIFSEIANGKLFSNSIKDGISGALDIEGAKGDVTGFVDDFKNKLGGINIGKILGLTFGASSVASILNFAVLESDFSKMVLSFKGVGDTLKNAINSIFHLTSKKEHFSSSFLKIAVAIGILAGALYYLADLPSDRLEAATSSLLKILGLMTALALLGSNLNVMFRKDSVFGVATSNSIGLQMLGIAAAVFILIGALKMLETLNPNGIMDRFLILAGIMFTLAAIIALLGKIAPDLTKGGLGILFIALAVKSLANTLVMLSNADTDNIKKGISSLRTIMIMLAILSLAASKVKFTSALGVLALVTSLIILEKALMYIATDFDANLILRNLKSFIIIFGTLFLLGIAVNLAHGKYSLQAGIAILSMAGALYVIALAMKKIANLSDSELNRSMGVMKELVGMAVLAITLVQTFNKGGLGTDSLKPFIGFALTIAVLVGALMILTLVDEADLKKATTALCSIILSFGAAMLMATKNKFDKKNSSFGQFLAMALIAVELAFILKMLAGYDWKSLLGASGAMSITLLSLAAAFAIAGKAKPDPKAIVLFLASTLSVLLIAEAIAPLALYDWKSLLGAALSISIVLVALAGTLALLTIAGAAAPAAGAGIVLLDALIADLAILFDVIGTTFSDETVAAIERGVDIVEKIGLGIGKFIGAIIGGFGEAVTNSLPTIGDNLSKFADNVQGFVDGVKNVDDDVLTGVKNLAASILNLSDASKSNFFKDEEGVSTFGKNMLRIGFFMSKFDEIFGDASTDISRVKMASEALLSIAEFAKAIPNQGNSVLKALVGDNTLSKFGEELEAFKVPFVNWCHAMEFVSPDIIERSSAAAKTIAEFASAIPNQGGALKYLIGDNTLGAFGLELTAFGRKFKTYSKDMEDVNPDVVTASSAAAQSVAEFANKIPNQGGALSHIIGDNTLSVFANEMVHFAFAFSRYNDIMKGINPSIIDASTAAAETVATFASKLENHGGFIQEITGDNKLSDFGRDLASFGLSFGYYNSYVKNIDQGIVEKSIAIAESLLALSGNVGENGSHWWDGLFGKANLVSFGADIELFGQNISKFYNHISDIKASKVNAVRDLVNAFADISDANGTSINSFAQAIKELDGSSLKSFLDSFSDESAISTAIFDMFKMIVAEIQSRKETMRKEGQTVGLAFINGLKTYVHSARAIGSAYVSAFIGGASSLGQSIYNSGASAGLGFVRGMESQRQAAVNAAAETGRQAVEALNSAKALDVNSPSKKTIKSGKSFDEGIVVGMIKMLPDVIHTSEQVGSAAVNAIGETINGIAEVIDSDLNLDPTIRPVLDLSDVSNGANQLNAMLSRSRAISIATDQEASNMNTASESGTDSGLTQNFNYTQNNYSPKALSRVDIYRQTRNQFAQLKGVAGV